VPVIKQANDSIKLFALMIGIVIIFIQIRRATLYRSTSRPYKLMGAIEHDGVINSAPLHTRYDHCPTNDSVRYDVASSQ
jgi:hypothetical protein